MLIIQKKCKDKEIQDELISIHDHLKRLSSDLHMTRHQSYDFEVCCERIWKMAEKLSEDFYIEKKQ